MPTRPFFPTPFLLALVLELLTPHESAAQVLPFHTFTTIHGLISNTINDLFQDSRGFLWIATFDGLSVYDGYTFTSYTSLDGLAHHLPWCVTESRHSPGTLLIGTNGGGVSRFRDGMFTTLRLGSDHEENEVSRIVEDNRGALWCLTNAGIVIAADGAPIKLQLHQPNAIMTLAQSTDSILWIGENNTLYRFSSSRVTLSRVTIPLRHHGVINNLSPESRGGMWVLGSDSSLLLYRDTSLVLRRHLRHGMPGSMLVDRQGIAWITLLHNGVLRIPTSHLPGGEFEHLTSDNGLPSNDITALLLDREENLWFGSHDKGVGKLSEKNILRFTLASTILGLAIDRRAHVWAATEREILECWNDAGGWRTATHTLVPSASTIRSMTLDREGRLWCVLSDNSIRAYDITAFRGGAPLQPMMTLRAGVHFPNVSPFLTFVDHRGLLWYTAEPTGVGVVRLGEKPKLERHFSYPADVPVGAVRAIYEDTRDNLWFGGFGDGLAMLPNAEWRNTAMHHLTTDNGLPDNGIRSIAEDDEGRLWIGTRYGGLAIYDGTRFQTLSARDGMLSNAVWSIAKGPDGRMWLGTSLGLMFVRSSDPHSMGWNAELTGTDTRMCATDTNGRIWVVGSQTLSLYEPTKDFVNTVPPPIYISHLTINGKATPVQQEMELSSDQNNVALQFLGVSFRHGLRYHYRLKGVDAGWSQPSSKRDVTYATLSPGTYAFEVLAINNAGISSAQPATLTFTIQPPIWRRWWFLAGAGLLLSVVFGGTVKYVSTQKLQRRVQELEKDRAIQLERERTRERIARDLHDDVASTLGSVVIYAESLKRQVQHERESAGLAERISTLSQEAQDALGDIVWSTSPTHDTLKDLLTRISDLTAEMCSPRGITYTLTIPSSESEHILQNDVRKSLLLIFKEAMNNIVRHSGATAIAVTAELPPDGLRITIADNGKGFTVEEQDATSRGHGLRNMRRRAADIGAQLTIHSTPGRGTSVSILFRLDDSNEKHWRSA